LVLLPCTAIQQKFVSNLSSICKNPLKQLAESSVGRNRRRLPPDNQKQGINNLALEPRQHADPRQKRRHSTRAHGGSSGSGAQLKEWNPRKGKKRKILTPQAGKSAARTWIHSKSPKKSFCLEGRPHSKENRLRTKKRITPGLKYAYPQSKEESQPGRNGRNEEESFCPGAALVDLK
jgi:hypothetical protein